MPYHYRFSSVFVMSRYFFFIFLWKKLRTKCYEKSFLLKRKKTSNITTLFSELEYVFISKRRLFDLMESFKKISTTFNNTNIVWIFDEARFQFSNVTTEGPSHVTAVSWRKIKFSSQAASIWCAESSISSWLIDFVNYSH